MPKDKCASCECAFPTCCTQHATRTVSSLYGSHGVLLCSTCAKAEEHTIQQEGTNDIPSLLRTYNLNGDTAV